eukprot:3588294-Prymnesium_polylepis.1
MARRVAPVVCMDSRGRGPRHVGRYSFVGVGACCAFEGGMQSALGAADAVGTACGGVGWRRWWKRARRRRRRARLRIMTRVGTCATSEGGACGIVVVMGGHGGCSLMRCSVGRWPVCPDACACLRACACRWAGSCVAVGRGAGVRPMEVRMRNRIGGSGGARHGKRNRDTWCVESWSGGLGGAAMRGRYAC